MLGKLLLSLFDLPHDIIVDVDVAVDVVAVVDLVVVIVVVDVVVVDSHIFTIHRCEQNIQLLLLLLLIHTF